MLCFTLYRDSEILLRDLFCNSHQNFAANSCDHRMKTTLLDTVLETNADDRKNVLRDSWDRSIMRKFLFQNHNEPNLNCIFPYPQ